MFVGGVLFSLEEGASFIKQGLTWRMVITTKLSTVKMIRSHFKFILHFTHNIEFTIIYFRMNLILKKNLKNHIQTDNFSSRVKRCDIFSCFIFLFAL